MHNLLKKRFAANSKMDFEYIFNLMYSVYSLPNIILPLIGGIMIFKYGYRIMFLVFGFSILIGQLIFALGCSMKSIIIMLIGRTIFGFGGESINTTQFSIILQWFAPNEIAFAMGLCLSFAKIGNALNNVISPRIATVSFILFLIKTSDVCSAMWLGFAICSFSFLCSILLVYLDWRQDILIQMKEIVSSNAGITVQSENVEEEKTIYSIKTLPKVKKN
jgi:MFS family permease